MNSRLAAGRLPEKPQAGERGWGAGQGRWPIAIGLSLPLVWREPAPVDLVLALLFTVCLTGRRERRMPVAVAVVSPIYFASALIPMYQLMGRVSAERFSQGARSIAIDAFLVAAGLAVYMHVDRSRIRLELVFRWMVYGCGACAVAILALRFFIAPNASWLYRDKSMIRIKGTFEDPNVLGPYMAIGGVGALALPRTTRREQTIIFAIGMSCLMTLILTLSRGALLVAVVSCGSLLSLRHKSSERRIHPAHLSEIDAAGRMLRRMAQVGAAAVGLILVVSWLGEGLFEQRLQAQEYDATRFNLNQLGIAELLRNPLGMGAAGFEAKYDLNVHNLFIAKAADSGLVAGALVALVFLAAIRAALIAFRRTGEPVARVVCALLVGHLAASMFVYSHHWRHLVVLVALSFAARNSARGSDDIVP